MQVLDSKSGLMTMDSREIADLTGKDHGNVMRDIRQMLDDLQASNLNPVCKSSTYIGVNGQNYPQYELDRDACLTLLLGYDAVARMRVVRRWQELEDALAPKLPQTMAQALRLAADQAEQIEHQHAQLALAAPKVEFVDRFVDATGLHTFRQVAKLLRANEARFREFLIERRIVYYLAQRLTPHQNHIDAGRFVVRAGVARHNDHAYTSAKFTAKGLEWIAGEWVKHQPLMFIITTAGYNIEGPCYDKRREVVEMLEGTVDNDELFGWIWTIDEGDDWKDPAVLAKANPNMGVSVYQEYLESQQRRAIQQARFTNTFKTKHLGLWVTAKTGFYNLAQWEALKDTSLTLEKFEGQACVLSFDLARKLDMNSMARLFWRDIDGKRHYYSVAPRFWVPEDTVANMDNRRMAERYQKWVNAGLLLQTDGAEIDYREILEEAKAANRLNPVQCSPMDPHGATNLGHQLDDEGLTPITITQNYTNMSDPMKEIEAAIASGRFHHDGNPIMTWCMTNVIGKHLPGNDDVVRPIKQGNDNKIDGAVALIMGVGRLLVSTEDGDGDFMDAIRNPMSV
jgi:Rha family phage regulatory protein